MAVWSRIAITIAPATAPGTTTEIQQYVSYRSARFDQTSNAGLGGFEFTVVDRDQTLGDLLVIGSHIRVHIDDSPQFGGIIMQVSRTFAFPAVDTTVVEDVTTRQFVVRGVSYNVYFDRLVARNTDDYYNALPTFAAGWGAGQLVEYLADNFLDLPTGLNTTTYVDNVGEAEPDGLFAWKNGGEQGIPWRTQMEWVSLKNGAVYYIDPDFYLHYHAPASVFSPWGFSDRPNNLSVAEDATTFTGALYGFREMDTQQDITGIANDVFVWGGSEWAAEGEIVFARRQNTDSLADHGRWQHAETHFGEQGLGLGIQEGVDARAAALVGDYEAPYVGTDPSNGVIYNASVPSWSVRLTWFGHDVPAKGALYKHHLVPGDIVTIVLWVHGSGPTTPLTLSLPLRSLSMSFPTMPSEDTGDYATWVRFDGTFSISTADPYNLWEAILRRQTSIRQRILTTATPDSTSATNGALWQGAPFESADGTRTVFSLRTAAGTIRYVAGTSEVYLNGLRMRQGADYQEQPSAGTITFFGAPPLGSSIWVYVRVA
jgi:hypothetical protein